MYSRLLLLTKTNSTPIKAGSVQPGMSVQGMLEQLVYIVVQRITQFSVQFRKAFSSAVQFFTVLQNSLLTFPAVPETTELIFSSASVLCVQYMLNVPVSAVLSFWIWSYLKFLGYNPTLLHIECAESQIQLNCCTAVRFDIQFVHWVGVVLQVRDVEKLQMQEKL